ncbi:unnamed protein product [Urochloa decumbens]|uniref:Aminotransferase-like plant mobile domain-containing protein n=1 Tax=Urochloa decumbens TaxID=240449 RepID=A0ABC9F390_9POAL
MFYDEQHRGKKLEERTQRYAHGALPTYDGESVATVGYLWHNMLNVHGNPVRRYVDYSNALDCLSHSHVTWEPYNREEVQNMELSPCCRMDEEYRRCPPEHIDTNKELHGIDRRKQRGAKDWALKHQGHVNAWNARAGNLVYGGAMHRDGPYQAYLDWLKANTRLKLKVAMDAQHIEDLPSNPEDVFDEYDDLTRKGTQPQWGPLEDYIGLQIGRFANESLQALSVPIGDPDEASRLRAYLQRFHRGCRKIAYKLNYIAPSAQAEAVEPSSSRQLGTSSRGQPTSSSARSGRSGQRLTATRTIGTPRRRGKAAAPRDEDEEEEESDDSQDTTNSEDNDPTFGGPDEIGTSQLPDAPSPTQGSPRPKRVARARDHTDVGSPNVLPTNPGRPRTKKKIYTPNPSRRK